MADNDGRIDRVEVRRDPRVHIRRACGLCPENAPVALMVNLTGQVSGYFSIGPACVTRIFESLASGRDSVINLAIPIREPGKETRLVLPPYA